MADDHVAITQMLKAMRGGDEDARGTLSTLIYDELHQIAQGLFARERAEHTLQPTAIVHEAYLRLLGSDPPDFENRIHFFATAAQVMRAILIDHARRVGAQKRGGGWGRITLSDAAGDRSPSAPASSLDLLDLEDALVRLKALDPRKAEVVELRFFGGLTNDEVASVLGLSRKTIVQDWTVARAWLSRELRGTSES